MRKIDIPLQGGAVRVPSREGDHQLDPFLSVGGVDDRGGGGIAVGGDSGPLFMGGDFGEVVPVLGQGAGALDRHDGTFALARIGDVFGVGSG